MRRGKEERGLSGGKMEWARQIEEKKKRGDDEKQMSTRWQDRAGEKKKKNNTDFTVIKVETLQMSQKK